MFITGCASPWIAHFFPSLTLFPWCAQANMAQHPQHKFHGVEPMEDEQLMLISYGSYGTPRHFDQPLRTFWTTTADALTSRQMHWLPDALLIGRSDYTTSWGLSSRSLCLLPPNCHWKLKIFKTHLNKCKQTGSNLPVWASKYIIGFLEWARCGQPCGQPVVEIAAPQ